MHRELKRAFRAAGRSVGGDTRVHLPPEPADVLPRDLTAPTWSMLLFFRIHTADPHAVDPVYRAVRRALRAQSGLTGLRRELREGYAVVSEARNPDRIVGLHARSLGDVEP